MRTIICIVALGLVLGVLNFEISKKERIVNEGRTVLLELAPRDPRSIMQGDYMVLRYAVAQNSGIRAKDGQRQGQLVIGIDENDVGTFRRVHDGTSLATDEILIDYRLRRRGVRLGAEEYFFEEGSAPLLENARYGEVRVGANGEVVLIGLRDAERNVLGKRVLAPDATGLFIAGN